jgi:zinc carboxypeptidase
MPAAFIIIVPANGTCARPGIWCFSSNFKISNRMCRKTFLTLSLLAVTTLLFGQKTLLPPGEFLPHHLGEQFTEHSLLVAYYQQVAANSDRMKLVEFGRTNEGRPQILAIISSPENMARIEEIRLNNLRNAGLAGGTPDNTNPVTIVWLGFSVHGNEAAGSEASMDVIYHLADPDNGQTGEWLKNTVVLIEPSVNPDGYSRYTSWYRQASPGLPDPNPAAREHDEPWPGGRVNHYLFDLNRDWAWTTQVESRNRIKIYNEWLPQVAADLHEQGYTSPYYFAPAAQPYHTFLTDWQSDFQIQIGKNHAKYFDKNGWLYFTREVFDLFYPSYGDTYPCFNGAIGMTYEQGGHSRAGRAIALPNGDTLTLADRVAHHKTAALSTVEISSMHAAELVNNFTDYFKKSQDTPPGEYKSFIVRASNPAHKLEAFTTLLNRHLIQYGKAGKTLSGTAAYDYSTGETAKITVDEGDLVVSAFQPKGLFAQVLLEPDPMLTDSLTYDITAWSLIHAYGLDAYASKERIEPASDFEIKKPVTPRPGRTPYAWLGAWDSFQSARFLAECLKNGIVPRCAEEAFDMEGRHWPAGTLIITRADNRKNAAFNEVVLEAAAKTGFELTAAKTGFVDSGHDFGSGKVSLIEAPKVLVLSGEKTFNNEFGQVWFYFDKDLGYPATIIDAEQLSRTKLDDYDVLVLPEGHYGFGDRDIEKLSSWVSAGGRLISLGYANRSLADKKGFGLARFAKDSDKDDAKKAGEAEALEQRTARYMDRVRTSISDNMPGAVVGVKMDASHPLAFGLKDLYFSLKTNGLRFDLVKGAWNVGYLADDYITHGFIGSNLKKELKKSAVFAVENKGRGKVIYLIDNPLFRSFWEEGKLLFSNAVFLVN